MVLRYVRKVVLSLTLFAILLFMAGVPLFFSDLRDHCAYQNCDMFYNPAPGAEWLSEHGLTPTQYALAYSGIYVIFGGVNIAAAILMYRKRKHELMGLLGTLALTSFGVSFTPILDSLSAQHPLFTIIVRIYAGMGYTVFTLFFALFPNGRFVPKWTAWLIGMVIAIRLPGILFPGTVVDLYDWSQFLVGIWLLAWTGSLLYIQSYRYRYDMGPVERQQTKWVLYGLFVGFVGLVGLTVVYILFESSLLVHPIQLYLLEIGIHGVMLFIPTTMLIAILRHRLWDIDPLLNRTLVYGFLTVIVVSVYVLAAWYINEVLASGPQLLISLLATAIVAVMFTPLKNWLHQLVNRMMYGRGGDPYTVLAMLGKRLEQPHSPEAVLGIVAKTIRETLRLPYVSLCLDKEGETVLVAEDGAPQEANEQFTLIHQGERLGTVQIAHRTPDTVFSPADRDFIDVLVRQAGAIVQGVKFSMDLKLLAADLQESRGRLVMAREEERRRLRRNLHDDMAPRLAALNLSAAAAAELLDSDPQTAKSILAEIRSVIRHTVADIRILVDDLRPPAVDELGLIGAVRERIEEISRPMNRAVGSEDVPTIQFELDAPAQMQPLPAAVEVAAYRILTEAIVNVVRHSKATCCRVGIRLKSEQTAALELEVTDNGEGNLLHGTDRRSTGLGLHSMRERASELGGSCSIERNESGGTRVWAYLPLTTQEEGSHGKTSYRHR
ncbi:MAG: sensor histidine kinase [Clostridia bacterium]